MVDFNVTVLGCGSAKPSLHHHTTSQMLNHAGTLYMIDCGEGTQIQILRYGLHTAQLNNIFITHAHGDHCLGLVGLISSLSLNGRTQVMNIYVPYNFVSILRSQLDFFVPHAQFEVKIHSIECNVPDVIFSDEKIEITAFPLNHRVPCYGFLFREVSGDRHIRPEVIEQYGIPYDRIGDIKRGSDFVTQEGRIIPNAKMTLPPTQIRSYAFVSDTRPMMEYAELLHGVDLLYHEATYVCNESSLAIANQHSTAEEAAEFALKSNAGRLLLGHFSSRYERNEQIVLDEAVAIFKNTELAEEGKVFEIRNS